MQFLLIVSLVAIASSQDNRNAKEGVVISNSLKYYDQPQIVISNNGTWLCIVTAGAVEEGNPDQNVYLTKSNDVGQTWSDLYPVEAPHPFGPPASYGNPILTPSDRLYVYYTYNIDNITTFPGQGGGRHDMVGVMAMRYTEDMGSSWSDRFIVPIPEKQIDKDNQFHGRYKMGWSVGKYITINQTVFMQYTKRLCQSTKGCSVEDKYVPMQEFVITSSNIMFEQNASKLSFETEPSAEIGLQTSNCDLAEEGDIVALNQNGDLYFTIRSFDGFVGVARKINGTWFDKEKAVYWNSAGGCPTTNQTFLKNINGPISSRRFYYFPNGSLEDSELPGTKPVYLLLYYNRGMPSGGQGTASWGDRNPYWLTIGFPDENCGIIWSQPEIVLYELGSPLSRIGYPDLFPFQHQLYMTETNKEIARLHHINQKIVVDLLQQVSNRNLVKLNLTLDEHLPKSNIPIPKLPLYHQNGSFTMEIAVDPRSFIEESQLLSCFNDNETASLIIQGLKNNTFKVTNQPNVGTKFILMSDQATNVACGDEHLTYYSLHIDGNAKVISQVINDQVSDGKSQREMGFLFDYTQNFGDIIINSCQISTYIHHIRLFSRCLSNSETIGNFRNYTQTFCL